MREIKKAAVIGAGTMGSGIAAHLAGVGIETYLLDIVPKELTEEEKKKGLTLKDAKVRNRIVAGGLERTLKSRPAAFYDLEDKELITIGNIEDNLDFLKEVDWIVEVVFERLDVKRNIFSIIEKNRKKDSIVSSNTSGISLRAILEGLSSELKSHSLITHFFNPVRYMRLLEVVPVEETDKEVLNFMLDLGEKVLGKGVVIAKDTPNFIANRVGVFGMMYLIKVMVEEGYKIEEIDKIFGPALGRPKSAVFRTADLVGLDVLKDVSKNMYENLSDDEMRSIYQLPEFMVKMVEKRLLGAKTKQGFYKKAVVEGKTDYQVLDYNTLEYRSQEKVKFNSLSQAKGIEDVGERIKAVCSSDDRAGKIAWKAISGTLIYAGNRIPEIADNIYSIDNALKWGFNWSLGPFETWDALGVKESVKRMEKEGEKIPKIVEELLKKGESFYKQEGEKKSYFDLSGLNYEELKKKEGVILLADVRAAKKEIKKLSSATLFDIGDGVALLEFHSRMNSIDEDLTNMINFSLEEVRKNFLGLVIGNEGENFSAGANVMLIFLAMQNKQWDTIKQMVKGFQDTTMAIKYSEKPVVTAPFNMALGGGCEINLAASRIRAHAELYMGLVEFGMGLLPGGGGNKEVWIRLTEGIPSDANVDLYPLLQRTFETIGLAKVSTSAQEAKKLFFLRPSDQITVNKDRLIADAKKTVLAMVGEGFKKRREKKIKVLGRNGRAALEVGIKNFRWGGRITEHEEFMAKNLAKVLTGGEVEEGTLVSEQYLLDLEVEAFLSLCGTEKTKERIGHFLTTGKPLRN